MKKTWIILITLVVSALLLSACNPSSGLSALGEIASGGNAIIASSGNATYYASSGNAG